MLKLTLTWKDLEVPAYQLFPRNQVSPPHKLHNPKEFHISINFGDKFLGFYFQTWNFLLVVEANQWGPQDQPLSLVGLNELSSQIWLAGLMRLMSKKI